eukprot:s294_g13.t1
MKRFALSRGTGGVNSGIAVLDCKVSGISYEKFDGPKAVDLKIRTRERARLKADLARDELEESSRRRAASKQLRQDEDQRELQQDFASKSEREEEVSRQRRLGLLRRLAKLEEAPEEETAREEPTKALLEEEKATAAEKVTTGKADVAGASKAKAEAEKLLATVTEKCASSKAEFEQRSATRTEESPKRHYKALQGDEAKSLLSTAAFFLQLKAVDQRQARAAEVLSAAGKRLGNQAMITLGLQAKGDGILKVQEAIDGMVRSLTQQQKDEVISHSLVRFGPGNRFSLYNQVAPNASEALFFIPDGVPYSFRHCLGVCLQLSVHPIYAVLPCLPLGFVAQVFCLGKFLCSCGGGFF